MKPPYEISPKSYNLSLSISEVLGQLAGIKTTIPQPELRKQNRIRTIQGSLAIEGNTLSTEQVTALVDKKRVIGPKKEIIEVVNAIEAYENLTDYRSSNEKSMLKAHRTLMKGLITDAGQYRKQGVGIFKGKTVSHMAPPHSRVPDLMQSLFDYLKKDKETHTLIKSCVFHYELMFIHPFSDGNGRIGRLWQSVILLKYHQIFEYVPIESIIKTKQRDYYTALEKSDSEGNSTAFIEFMLDIIIRALNDLKKAVVAPVQTPDSRLLLAREFFKKQTFTRKSYIQFHKTISTATASRDLKQGVDRETLKKKGERALATYMFC